jgi:tRNA (cytidine/uridine-2'-O-)-methyltransferase
MFELILHEPQIPPNTGSIIRLCANTGCRLHLIEPLGFALSRRAVRRAGLDYALLASVRVHRDWSACRTALTGARVYAIETTGERRYSDVAFVRGDALLFGSETRGLPPGLLAELAPSQRLRIPMQAANRSLNLANAAALVVYEAWRQQNFAPA